MINSSESNGSRSRLLSALKMEPYEGIPWLPFVGVHGGSLIGVDATQYLQDADCIVRGLKAAHERYQPDGLPIVFDLQIEAEILGCKLVWAKETPPSVASHPLDDSYDLKKLPCFSPEKGRMPLILDATRRIKRELGAELALYGILTGPLTLAMHLRGDDLLLDMFDAAADVPRLLDYCAGVAEQMVDAYLDAGIDVIAVVDPMISQISPQHFRDLVASPLNRIFDHTRTKGALSSLFVCGNATRSIEAMCQTRCDNISVDENVDMSQLAANARQYGKSFGGNLQLTVVLLFGDSMDAQRDVIRCLDQAGEVGGFVLAPGCDLPFAVKPENLEIVSSILRDPYQMEIARKLPPNDFRDDFSDIEIPVYAKESSVIVDVVTLDSAGCAPCAYMVTAAREGAKAFGKPVEVREHKIINRDGLGYMARLGVSAIPSICVDGKEKFASIIPSRKELVATLDQALKMK